MPSDPQQLSAIQTALRVSHVKGRIGDLFNTGTFTLDVFNRGTGEAPMLQELGAARDGKFIAFHAIVEGNPNVAGGIPEKGSYQRAGSMKPDWMRYRRHRMNSAMSQTAEIMSRSDSDVKAVLDVATRERMSLKKVTKKRENWWAIGDGSGILATPVANGWDNTNKYLTVDNLQMMKKGMDVHLLVKITGAGAAAWPTVVSNGLTELVPALITEVKKSTKQIKLTMWDGAVINYASAATFDSFGVYQFNSLGRVPNGLGIACSVSNPSQHGFDPSATLPVDEVGLSRGFGGVDRNNADNEWWVPLPEADLAGAALNLKAHIEKLELEVIEADDTLRNGKDCVFLSGYAAFQQIIHQLEASDRTTKRDRLEFNGSEYEVVRWGIFTFVWDYEIPDGDAFVFVPKHAFFLLDPQWGFEDETGSINKQLMGGLSRPTGVFRSDLISEQQRMWADVRPCKKYKGISAA